MQHLKDFIIICYWWCKLKNKRPNRQRKSGIHKSVWHLVHLLGLRMSILSKSTTYFEN